MRKISCIVLFGFYFSLVVFAQNKLGILDTTKLPLPKPHYQTEYTFDSPSDPSQWTAQKSGLQAAFGSTDQLYLRCEAPENTQLSNTWASTGWRGQRLNGQILVWSPDPLEQVRFKIHHLVNSTGKTIGQDYIKLSLVRYVVSNFGYGETVAADGSKLTSAWLMPDRLEPFERIGRFDLPARTVRPVWLTLDIPATCAPGDYSGTVEISSTKGNAELKLKVTVQKLLLPKPSDWKFRLDLWQNPWVVAWYYHVEPWSAEHKLLLKKHLRLYAEAGGKYITTYAVHSPWSDNSYMIENSMIDWIQTRDGNWKFDFAILDQYVELAMEAGIDKAITIYTPIPWGNRFRYLDEASGNFVYATWAPTSTQFKEVWNVFLNDLKAHLTQKDWFKKTHLGINENPMEQTLAAIKVIKEHSPDWKITYAGNWHPELSRLLDDYSPIITSEPSPAEIEARKSAGKTTSYYVCCAPARPNNFVFSPPVESRYLGWHAAAFGYDGFLRWAYDAWPADPVRDARHTLWPAGDCFLVYPGGNSSIRFEKLREGIADYEKIRILRELASKSTAPKVTKMIKALDAHLAAISTVRDHSKRDLSTVKLIDLIQIGNQLVNSLSSEIEP